MKIFREECRLCHFHYFLSWFYQNFDSLLLWYSKWNIEILIKYLLKALWQLIWVTSKTLMIVILNFIYLLKNIFLMRLYQNARLEVDISGKYDRQKVEKWNDNGPQFRHLNWIFFIMTRSFSQLDYSMFSENVVYILTFYNYLNLLLFIVRYNP